MRSKSLRKTKQWVQAQKPVRETQRLLKWEAQQEAKTGTLLLAADAHRNSSGRRVALDGSDFFLC